MASVLCLAHPPQCFSGCLFRDLTAERHRPTPPIAPCTSAVSFVRPPGAGKGLTTLTPPMRRSPRSRGEGPCPGADPRDRKRGRPSSFPGLQGHVSARGCQPEVCARGLAGTSFTKAALREVFPAARPSCVFSYMSLLLLKESVVGFRAL